MSYWPHATSYRLEGEAIDPDNSRINERDRSIMSRTADDQGRAQGDIELTQQIRRGLVGDSGLSTYGQNIEE